MALAKMTVWKDRANPSFIQLFKDGVVLPPEQFPAITKVGLHYKGVYYNSADFPNYFDWVTYAAASKVMIKPGLLGMPIGADPSELLIYDAVNAAGIVWMQIAIQVRGDAAI